jgi:hypothetical protein
MRGTKAEVAPGVCVWATLTAPSDAVYRAVVEWIIAAEVEPWKAPSTPIGDPGPVACRTALLPDVEVRIVYLIEHVTGILTVVEVD